MDGPESVLFLMVSADLLIFIVFMSILEELYNGKLN